MGSGAKSRLTLGATGAESLGSSFACFLRRRGEAVMRSESHNRAVIGALALSLLAMTSAAERLWGQVGTSAILGYIYDASGAAVAHAKVTLTSPGIGFERSGQSDSGGYYKFANLL